MLQVTHQKALVQRSFLLLAWLMLPISAGAVWWLEYQLLAEPTVAQQVSTDPRPLNTQAPAQESQIQGLKSAILQGQGQELHHEPGQLPSPGGELIMRVKRQLAQQFIQEISVRSLSTADRPRLEQFYHSQAASRGLDLIQQSTPKRSQGLSLLFGRDQITLRVLLLERQEHLQVLVEYSYPEQTKPGSP